MHEFLDAGKCIVFLLERLADCVDEASPAAAPLRTLQHVMNEHLGGLATVHLWLSGREGKNMSTHVGCICMYAPKSTMLRIAVC